MDRSIEVFIGLIVAIIVFFSIDMFGSKTKYVDGILLEKVFTPESNSTFVGYNQNANGGGVIVGDNHQSEQFKYIVQIENNVETADVHKNKYFKYNTGDFLKIKVYIGRITGVKYMYLVE
ncbi:hypothetical protein [Elizabethkingia anophelis]|uniref:hypothetical protein n=1 Tax=Elizabethkingia anophelis TaxID=1117645 RepID=UPI003891C956